MRVAAGLVSLCLTLFLLGGGCSREEEPPTPVKTEKVVKTIKRPPPEEAPMPSPTPEVKVEQEETQGEEVKVVSVEEKAPKKTEAVSEEIETVLEEVGYYKVRSGDSLFTAAAREDVYGDPLKWPALYRLNMSKLENMTLGEDFPERSLPEGLMLKIITPEEVKENLKNRANNFWVINVRSSTNKGKIIPPAISLIKNGYPVYITRATVKGKDYMRLRVGFFQTRSQANEEGKKIMALLSLADSWANKIGPKEFEEFARY